MTRKSLVAIVFVTCLVGAGFASANTIEVNANAAMNGTNFGLEATPDDSGTKAFVQSDHPSAETSYNVEFYVNPNTLNLQNNKLLDIFRAFSSAPNNHMRFQLQWKDSKSNYKIRVLVRENSTGKFRIVGKITLLPSTDTLLKVEWTSGAGDGTCRVLKNGKEKANVTDLTNDAYTVDYVRLGIPAGSNGTCVGGTCVGSIFLDEFVSTR